MAGCDLICKYNVQDLEVKVLGFGFRDLGFGFTVLCLVLGVVVLYGSKGNSAASKIESGMIQGFRA